MVEKKFHIKSKNSIFSLNSVQIKSIGMIAFVFFSPVFIWPFLLPIMVFSSVFLFLLLVINKRVKRKDLILAFILFFALIFYKELQGASILGMLYFSFSASCLMLVRDDRLIESFSVFKIILAVMVGLGVWVWFVHVLSGDSSILLLGYVPDHYVLNPLKIESGVRYALYPFSTKMVYLSGSEFYRFQSVFDEPGRLGTVCALVFVVSKGSLKGVVNKIIFLGGIVSFSLAFYVIVGIYYLLVSVTNPFKLIKVVIVTSIALCLISLTPLSSTLIGEQIIDRLSIQDGRFKGNNRATKNLDSAFDYFLDQAPLQEKLFGLRSYEPDGSSSIKQIPVKTGYVGIFMILVIFSSIMFFYRSKFSFHAVVFIFIFFLSAVQRPDITNPGYIYLFVVGLLLSEKLELGKSTLALDLNTDKVLKQQFDTS